MVPIVSLTGILLLANRSNAQISIVNNNVIGPVTPCTNGQVITYNTTTGAWDTCAANAQSGTISGTIATGQIAVGTGVDTIGGDADFKWVDPYLLFTSGKGLSFAGLVSPTTIVGGTLDEQSSLIINNATDGYVRISIPVFSDINVPADGMCITPNSYTAYFCVEVFGGLGRLHAQMPTLLFDSNSSTTFEAPDTVDAVLNLAADSSNDATDRWVFTVAATDNAITLSNNSNNYFSILTAGAITGPTNFTSALYSTTTNCSDSAGAAACSAATAGQVVIDAAATTVVVSTTAVTANSEIFIQEDPSAATRLGVTCNTTTGRDYTVTARTAATSFTITSSAAPVTNPACLNYYIVN